MKTYHYDQGYPYKKMRQEVKDLIIPTMKKMICPQDQQHYGVGEKALKPHREVIKNVKGHLLILFI